MKSVNKNQMKQLAHQFNLMNTVGGGVSKTSVEVLDFEDKTELKIFAPGVNPEAFKIFINNNQLMVFSIISENEASIQSFIAPLFSRSWVLPPYVDDEQIEALQEGNVLKIVLPFKNSSKQNIRKIDIRNNF